MVRCDAIEWEDKNKGPALVREPVLGVFISEIYFDSSYIEDRLKIKPCPPSEP